MFIPNIIKPSLLFIAGARTFGAVPVYNEVKLEPVSKRTAELRSALRRHGFRQKYASKRATNEEFVTQVGQMQMIARIANGIHLQQGFVKGNISVDEFISELLNFTESLLAELDSMGTDKLNEVIQKIQALPKSLKTDAGTVKIENRLGLLGDILLEAIDVDTVEPPGDEFLQEIQRLRDVKVDYKPLSHYASAVSILHDIKHLVETGGHLEKSDDEIAGKLELIIRVVPRLKKDLQAFQGLKSDTLGQSAEFSRLTSFHKSVVLYSQNKNQLKYVSKTDDPHTNNVAENLRAIGSIIEDAKGSESDFDNLESLFVLRHRGRGNRVLSHVPAFAFGSSEILLVSTDLIDPWVQKVIGGEGDKLLKALPHLPEIGKLAKDVEDAAGSTESVILEKVSGILKRVTTVSQLNVPFESLASGLSTAQKAAIDKDLIPKNFQKYKNLHTTIDRLKDEVDAVGTLIKVSEAIATPENAGKLDRIVQLAAHEDGDNVHSILEALVQSEDFKSVMELALPVQKNVKLLIIGKTNKKDVLPIANSAGDIVKDWKEMGDYTKNSVNFLTMLGKLRNIGGLESMRQVIGVRAEISATEKEEKTNFDSIAQKTKAVQATVKALKTSITKIKGFKSVETDRLLGLADVAEMSHSIGTSTLGIMLMKSGKELKSDWSFLKSIKFTIETELKNVQMEKKEIAALNGLDELENQINVWYHGLETFVDSVVPSSSTKLEDHSDIFEKAKSVKGIDYDLTALIAALEKLASKSSTQLHKDILFDAADKLQKLQDSGVDYSRFNAPFDESKDSMKNLELFFANHAKIYAPTTPSPLPAGKTKRPSSGRGTQYGQYGGQGVLSETTTAASKFYTETWFFCVLGGVVSVIVIIIAVCCCCQDGIQKTVNKWKRGKKEKPANNENRGNPPPSPIVNPHPPAGDRNVQPQGGEAPAVAAAAPGAGGPQLNPPNAGVQPLVPANNVAPVPRVDRQDFQGRRFGFDYAMQTNDRGLRLVEWVANGMRQHNLDGFLTRELTQTDNPRGNEQFARLHENEQRDHSPINVNTLINGTEGEYLHGNLVHSGNARLMVVQSPIGGLVNGDSVIARMYRSVKRRGCRNIMLFNNLVESGSVKYDEYFEHNQTFTYGTVQVTCGAPVIRWGCVERCELTIKCGDEEPYTVTHWHFKDWNFQDHMPLDQLRALGSLLKHVMALNDGPLWLNCTDGLRNSGAVALVILTCEYLRRDQAFQVREVIASMRRQRSGIIVNDKDLLNALMCLVEMIAEGNLGNRECRENRRYIHGKYNEKVNLLGRPSYDLENPQRD